MPDRGSGDRSRGAKRKRSEGADPTPLKRRRSDHPAGTHHYPGCSNGGIKATDQVPERHPVAGSKDQQETDRESRKSAHKERNTLDAVKRSLLRRSDWMGLNAARPLHMDFPSAQEMENIGRRRKITAKERERLEEAHRKPSRFTTKNHVLNHRQPSLDTCDEIPSIRVGSNIHQSQTTTRPSRRHNPRSVVCQSESSESMLLDKEVSSYQHYVGVQSSPEYVMTASLGTAEAPAREEPPREEPPRESIGSSFVSLDEVRDSETFDEVKARSHSLIELKSGNQQQRFSKGTKRRAANRGLPSEQAKSSSIVTGRRLLQSTPSCSPGSNLQANTQSERPPGLLRQKRLKQAPDSLSSDFLPPCRRSCYNREGAAKVSSNGIRELPSKFHDGSDGSSLNNFPHSGGQNQLEARPKFTLEHQIEAEAAARDLDRAPNAKSHPIDDPPIMTRTNDFKAIGDTYPVGNKIDVVSVHALTPQQRRASGEIESSLAAATATGHKMPTETAGRRRYDTEQSVPNSRMTTRSTRGDCTMAAPLRVSRMPGAARDFGPHRQHSYGTPMRQPLGVSQEPASRSNDRSGMQGSQKDEDQAWMQFVLQDGPDMVSKYLNLADARKRESDGVAHRWLQHHADDDETLPEDYELPSSLTRKRSGSSPVQTFRTMANTTIYEADADVGVSAIARSQPSETDFLSQLSPMEGRLDDRLFNPSLYTNPARTERSYIAAPSRMTRKGSNGIESDFFESSSLNINNAPPVDTMHHSSLRQASSIDGSPASHLHSRISTVRPFSRAMPSMAIPASFPERRRSPLNALEAASGPLNSFSQSYSTVTQASGQENSEPNWQYHPSEADSMPPSARREVSLFPMNYTPIRHALKKPRQDQLGGLRPSTSYISISQANHGRNGLTSHKTSPILHRKTSSHAQSSLHSPIRQPAIYDHAGDLPSFHSAPPAHHPSHQHTLSPSSPLRQSPPPFFRTPSALAVLPPTHTIFEQPPPPSELRPSHRPPETPFSARGPIRRPHSPTPGRPEPFSTPRLLRSTQPVSPPQGHEQPFSTPRLVRPVLGRFRPPERWVELASWGVG